jgi:hypothetical protein
MSNSGTTNPEHVGESPEVRYGAVEAMLLYVTFLFRVFL